MASATAVNPKLHRAAGNGQPKKPGAANTGGAQLHAVSAEIARLVQASQEGRLSERARTENFDGEAREMMHGLNLMLDAILLPIEEGNRVLAKISEGQIDELIANTYKGDHEKMKLAVNKVGTVLQGLHRELAQLTEAAHAGQLSERGHADRFHGAYADIVRGFNTVLDAVITPLNVAAGYIDRISKGQVPARITEGYRGDFNTIKDNLNTCIDSLAGLEEINRVLGKMAVNDYSLTVNGSYPGIFAELAASTNEALGRSKNAVRICGNIAAGEFKQDLADLKSTGRRSAGDTLIPAFIQMMESIAALVDDAEMLSRAAVAGNLNTRADASRHQGEYRNVVAGVNATLDAVIGPLNVAAKYVESISKGEVPGLIAETYQGEFNTIKDNLNTCVASLGGLHEVNQLLGKMAVNDYSSAIKGSYPGIFAQLATSAIEAQERVKAALRLVHAVAVGEFAHDLEELKRIGKRSENDTLMPNFIHMMEAIEALAADTQMLTGAAVAGKLATRADASRHQGDYRKIVQGVNEMLDAILLPIGEGNRILAQISAGKIDELIAQTYKGDHEKMKLAVNNVAVRAAGAAKGDGAADRSLEGRPALRARQAGTVPGGVCRDRARRQHHAGRDPAAHRRRQPHPGADLRRQDRRADRADLQGRPRKDEAGGQQRRRRAAGAAEGAGAADRSLEGRPALRARQAGAVPGRVRRDRARRERHAGCDSAAHRRRQSHSGADLRRQDRRADRADLQGRPREDEAGGQQCRPSCCRACTRNWRG